MIKPLVPARSMRCVVKNMDLFWTPFKAGPHIKLWPQKGDFHFDNPPFALIQPFNMFTLIVPSIIQTKVQVSYLLSAFKRHWVNCRSNTEPQSKQTLNGLRRSSIARANLRRFHPVLYSFSNARRAPFFVVFGKRFIRLSHLA